MTLAVSLPEVSLIQRQITGEDDWGQPVYTETPVTMRGYFSQWGADDPDREGRVNTETGKFILMPKDGVRPHGWLAIELTEEGVTRRFEIVGEPEAKYSLIRGTFHHWEVLVSRAGA